MIDWLPLPDWMVASKTFYRQWAIVTFGKSNPFECTRLLFNAGYRGKDLRWGRF